MRVKVERVGRGLHPSQVIVNIATRTGMEQLAVNELSLDSANTIDIGDPVGRKGSELLVELPAETDSGAWRVWVDERGIVGGALEAAESLTQKLTQCVRAV